MTKLFKVFVLSYLVFFIISSYGCKRNSEPKIKKKIDFIQNAYWDKPSAEYQRYDARVDWYGQKDKLIRLTKSLMVLVKENWDSKKNVKSDETKFVDSAVLKFSIMDQFNSGTYPSSFKEDLFFDVDNGEVIKYSLNSQDGCGNSSLLYEKRGKTGVFSWKSYWNDHGNLILTLPTDKFDTFFDALPVYLRFNFSQPEYSVKIIQSLIGNHPEVKDASELGTTYPKILKATVKNIQNQTLTISGKTRRVIKTEVSYTGKTDVFYFEEKFPHRLVKTSGDSKFKRVLIYADFFPYWDPANQNKPTDYFLNGEPHGKPGPFGQLEAPEKEDKTNGDEEERADKKLSEKPVVDENSLVESKTKKGKKPARAKAKKEEESKEKDQ